MTEEELAEVNALREKALSGLEPLRKSLKDKKADAEVMTRSIYEYLTDLSVQEHLLQYEQQFEQEAMTMSISPPETSLPG